MKKIPVIISFDVHSHNYKDKLNELPFWFERTLKILDNNSIKATFFFPTECAELFPNEVRMIQDEEHEIGCHSLTHLSDEQYDTLSFDSQKSKLVEAKKRTEEITNKQILSFRAPGFKINANTIRALDEAGFKIDSSVCPQRLGIFSSDITNIGWLYSPRKPYHPSYKNPFIRGKALLWEVPVSSFVLPFMSNIGMAFGRTVEKLFFKFFYTESTIFNKPIVYLLHPEDIYENRDLPYIYKFQWKHLLPSKEYGFGIRYALFSNKDPKKISDNIINLFTTMRNHKNINFLTYKKIIPMLEKIKS